MYGVAHSLKTPRTEMRASISRSAKLRQREMMSIRSMPQAPWAAVSHGLRCATRSVTSTANSVASRSAISAIKTNGLSPISVLGIRALHSSVRLLYASLSEAGTSPADYIATASRYKDVRFPVDPEDPGMLIEDTVDKNTDLFRVRSKRVFNYDSLDTHSVTPPLLFLACL